MAKRDIDILLSVFIVLFLVFTGYSFLYLQSGFNNNHIETETVALNHSKTYDNTLRVSVTDIQGSNVSFEVTDIQQYDSFTVTDLSESDTATANLNGEPINATALNVDSRTVDIQLSFSQTYSMSDESAFVFNNISVILLAVIGAVILILITLI